MTFDKLLKFTIFGEQKEIIIGVGVCSDLSINIQEAN